MPVNRRSAPATDYTPAPDAADSAAAFSPEDENDTTSRSSSLVRRGWNAAQKKIEETSSSQYADDWTPPQGTTLVKFLEDEPFATVGSHWVNEITEGKRSFYCLEDECPLCGTGHSPSAQVYFNVVPIANKDGAIPAQIKALRAGPMLADIVKQANDDKGGPLSRHFWALKKTVTKAGKSQKVNYSLSVVKARDLAEDWELDPDSVAASLADVKPYDESIIKMPDVETLQQIVEEHLSDD